MWRRFFHTGQQLSNVAQKSSLAALREKTGYTFSNCKKALTLHSNDIKKAEEWLHEQAKAEGWAKVNHLQNRAALNGLVGIACKHNMATMVEVNCETDFVARNNKFQELVASVTNSALDFYSGKNYTSENGVSKIEISKADLENMQNVSASGRLADLVAASVNLIGENISLRRGLYFHVGKDSMLISSYSHPPTPAMNNVTVGKYGALVVYRQIGSLPSDSASLIDLGKHLCQHVIGRNPKTLGSREEALAYLAKQELTDEIEAKEKALPSEEKQEDESEVQPVEKEKPQETALLLQDYLRDPSYIVAEYLDDHNLEIVDYVRFESGENASKA